MNRRTFLKGAALTGGLLSLGKLSLPRLHAAENPGLAPANPSWVDKPMRWAQLTLVEDDPGKFDLPFWLDYFKRTRSDAVCLSAGGCVAYYPTNVRFHHRSAWLGERDVFGELVAGCRKLGMVVIARTDPHATYDDVQAAHPDWIAVDAAGKPRRHWASPEMWVTCGLGPYNFELDGAGSMRCTRFDGWRPDGLTSGGAVLPRRHDASGSRSAERVLRCRRRLRGSRPSPRRFAASRVTSAALRRSSGRRRRASAHRRRRRRPSSRLESLP